MPTERLGFEGALGRPLAALLDLPEGEPRTYCLFAHAFGSSKDLRGPVRVARSLAGKGIATLRFDFTGCGRSEGDFAETSFSTNVEDVLRAVDFLRREYRAPEILMGHSLGGAAVLAAAREVPERKAVATIGSPSDLLGLRRRLEPLRPTIREQGVAEIHVAGNRLRIGQKLLDDLEEHDLREAVANLECALLILHSPTDDFVGVRHAARLFEAAKHPKSFVSLDHADHLLLDDERDARFVAGILATWAERYFCPMC